MSLFKIAWRSIQQRSLASALTALSMALGVSLVVAVLVVYNVVRVSFHRGGEGYDLVVGAKGSSLDLVLNAVYYIGPSLQPMSYESYKRLKEPGELPGSVEAAIPICLGDNYEGFRVVGTTADLFDRIKYMGGQPYRFAQGNNFDDEHYQEAVIGAAVARKTGKKVGDTFRPVHDVAGRNQHKHKPFTIVGVLEPTGTPNDRALFVNIEGFYRQPGHAGLEPAGENEEKGRESEKGRKGEKGKSEAKDAHEEHGDHDEHDHDAPLPDSKKRISAVLVCLDAQHPEQIRPVAQRLNQWPGTQAALPGDEISRLFEGTIGDVELVLLIFAAMILVVAGIGIMVSIYNSMSDRRLEIAIMRALGANRATILAVILLESILLSLGGGVLGLLLGHGAIELFSPLIADRIGMSVNLLQFQFTELILIPCLIVLASAVGFLPAVAAYRTDVARSLMAAP